jgi:hypothetical protein
MFCFQITQNERVTFVLFLVELGCEFKDLCLQSTHSTAWATAPVHFVLVSFGDGISWTICLGWSQTMVFLILVSQVGRITGVSHTCLAETVTFKEMSFFFFSFFLPWNSLCVCMCLCVYVCVCVCVCFWGHLHNFIYFFIGIGVWTQDLPLAGQATPPSLFLWWVFWDRVLRVICSGLTLNRDPPYLCLLSS